MVDGYSRPGRAYRRAGWTRPLLLISSVLALCAMPATGALADPTYWTIASTPNPAGSYFNTVTGVSCTGRSACTAVGYSDSATLGEHWNGTAWSLTPTQTPPGAIDARLEGVSCWRATCVAVGESFTTSGYQAMAELWNGSSWALQTVPTPGVDASLRSVSCVTAAWCTAVGYSYDGSAYHSLAEAWDGTAWTPVTTPDPPGATSVNLLAVSCASTSGCTAVGVWSNGPNNQVLAEIWNGSAWVLSGAPAPAGATELGFSGVSCVTITACTAVGYSYNGTNDSTLVETWNGTSWTIAPSPNPTSPNPPSPQNAFLQSVSCKRAARCAAAGYWYDGYRNRPLVETEHGSTWSIDTTPVPSGATSSQLAAVSCAYASSCVAVGAWTQSGGFSSTLAEVGTTPAASSMTVSASPSPSYYGESVTFTAAVSPTDGGGTVAFSADGVVLPQCTAQALALVGTVYEATCTTSKLAVGQHSVSASYTGDLAYAGSSGSLPGGQTVGAAPTSITVTTNPNPSSFGQSVAVVATVTPGDGGGTMTFSADGTALPGCTNEPVKLVGTSSRATCVTAAWPVGTHSVSASFSGDTNYAPSTSSAVSQTVNPAATTTAVVASANPAPVGPVTYTATVKAPPDGGTISFYDGGSALPGCQALPLTPPARAVCQVTYTAVGTHSITASYSGDADYLGSTSSVLSMTIVAANTATTLTSSANPAQTGQRVTYTAVIKPRPDGGTLSFADGGNAIAGCSGLPVNPSIARVTCTVTYPVAGSHSITASYSGDTNYNPSNSPVLDEQIS